jgi:hypothetical protein
VRPWSSFLSLRAVVRAFEKLRTVLPLTVGIRDGAVQLVSILGSAVISARAELGSILDCAGWGYIG